MINRPAGKTADFPLVNSGKILMFSFAQRMLLGIAAGIVGPLIPSIAKDLNTGLDRIGAAISFSLIAVFIVAVILNNLIDILGFKKVLIVGLAFVASGALGIFFLKTFTLFIIFYFLYQLGIGILSITIISIIGNTHFEEKSAKIIQTTIYYSLGSIAAPLLVSLFAGLKFNWQILFLALLAAQLILGVFLLFIKMPGAVTAKRNIKNFFKIDKKIVSNSYFIILGIMILLYTAVMDTFYTWFTSYYEGLHVAVSKSSLFLGIYSIACCVGLILKNKLIKKVEEKKILMWGVLLSLLFLILVFFINNLVVKNILVFFYGLCITGNFSFMVIISLNLGSKYASSIVTYTHAVSYLGSIIFQYIGGFMSEHFSKNSVFYIDISLLIIMFILAIVINRKKMIMP
jgi:MFS family permease